MQLGDKMTPELRALLEGVKSIKYGGEILLFIISANKFQYYYSISKINNLQYYNSKF